jgi:sec-independent protein translocase protein TatA
MTLEAPMGLGTGEIILIVVVVVMVFGASRLPQLGEGLGRAIGSFKRALGGAKEIETSIKSAVQDAGDHPKTSESPTPADKVG